MKNNKYPLTLKEASEKYELSLKVLRRLISDKLIGSEKRSGKYWVSGHDIKAYQDSKEKGISVKDKDRIKVLNDVENLRTKRLKNEKVVSKIIENQKDQFYEAFNKILCELPGLPQRLNFNDSQKTGWNNFLDELGEKINEEAQKISALKTWEEIVDLSGVSREEILKNKNDKAELLK